MTAEFTQQPVTIKIDTGERQVYTVPEIATMFGISTHAVYQQVAEKRFPIQAIQFGRAIRFPKPLTDAFLGKALFGAEVVSGSVVTEPAA